MSPHTVWQCIVGSVPTDKGLVIECFACGHPGKRTEPERAARRIAEGRTRLCLPCSKAQGRQARAQSDAAQRLACATKRIYLSAAAAPAEEEAAV